MSLLQSGWMEALLVGVAWRSQGASREELVFASNLQLDEVECRAAGLADLYEALRHLTARYENMKLSAEEAAALKAVALANSGTNADSAVLSKDNWKTVCGYFTVSKNGEDNRLERGRSQDCPFFCGVFKICQRVGHLSVFS